MAFCFQPWVTENRVRGLDAILESAVCRWKNRRESVSICLSPVIIICPNPTLGKVMEYWMLSVIFPFTPPSPVLSGKNTSTLCLVYLVQLSIASASSFDWSKGLPMQYQWTVEWFEYYQQGNEMSLWEEGWHQWKLLYKELHTVPAELYDFSSN